MRKFVILACVLLLLVSAAVLVGCGSGSGGSSSQTPEQVIKAFFDAYQKGDANTTWNLLSAKTTKALKTKATWESTLKALTERESDAKYTVGKVTVNGDKATARVTGTGAGASGTTATVTMQLVKENGAWKVYLAGAGGQ